MTAGGMLSREQLSRLERKVITAFSTITGMKVTLSIDEKAAIAHPAVYDRYYGNPILAAKSLSRSRRVVELCWEAADYELKPGGCSVEAHAVGSNGFRRYH